MARDYSSGTSISHVIGPGMDGSYTEVPSPPFYTDQSQAYIDAANSLNGATVNAHFFAVDHETDAETDITEFVEAGKIGEQGSDIPVDQPGMWGTYQIGDWTIGIRPNYVNTLKAILRSVNGGEYYHCKIQAYSKIVGVDDYVPVGAYRVAKIAGFPISEMTLVDNRIDAFKNRIHADGIAMPDGQYDWTHTIEIDSDQDPPPEIDDTALVAGNAQVDGLYINKSLCPIGEFQISFKTPGDNDAFQVTGFGIDKAGDINEGFYTHDTLDNSYFGIEPLFWTSGSWANGDKVTITFTHSFNASRVRVAEAMFFSLVEGGYDNEDFDAGANFPEQPAHQPEPDGMIPGYPTLDDENDDWVNQDADYGSIGLAFSWDWVNFSCMFDKYVQMAFMAETKVLECASEVGKHGPLYVIPDRFGKLTAVPFGYLINVEFPVISEATGLIRAYEDEKLPQETWDGHYGYNYRTGVFTVIHRYPDNNSEPYAGQAYLYDDEPRSIEFIGWSQYDKNNVRDVLALWQDYWGVTCPTIPIEMDYRGFNIEPGYYYKLESEDIGEDRYVFVTGITRNFTDLTCDIKTLNVSELWDRYIQYDVEDKFDTGKIFR